VFGHWLREAGCSTRFELDVLRDDRVRHPGLEADVMSVPTYPCAWTRTSIPG
jgi:hypothetical protein